MDLLTNVLIPILAIDVWTSVFTAIATLGTGFIIRVIVGVFKMGVNFKTELATKKEQKEFEQKILKAHNDLLLALPAEIKKLVDQNMQGRYADMAEQKKLLIDTRTEIKVFNEKINMYNKHFSEIDSLRDTVQSLTNRINRLEYGSGTQEVRRTDASAK